MEEPVATLLNRMRAGASDKQTDYVAGIIDLLSGLLARKNKDVQAAKEKLTRVRRTFEALRTPFELAIARMAAASTMESEQAIFAINKSVEEFHRLGATNKEIASTFGLTEGTVKIHIFYLYSKLGVKRRTQAIVRAKELRLLE